MDARPERNLTDTNVLRLHDGRRIGYAEYGDPDGLPVFALHGTPGSRFMFALTNEAAQERGLRLIAPERPGYGLSEFRHADSLGDIATDVVALADALGIGRCAIIGVSGGGPHAVAAAAALRERVALLALISPVGPIAFGANTISLSFMHKIIFLRMGRSPSLCRGFFYGLRAVLRFAPDFARGLLKRRVPPSDRAMFARPEVLANLQDAVREGLRRDLDGAVQDLRLFTRSWDMTLAELDVPAVLWQGSDDPIVPPEAAYLLARSLPRCRLEVIEEAGHYWIFGRFNMVLDAAAAALAPRPALAARPAANSDD